MPWRRPGFQLGLDIAEIKAATRRRSAAILGGHGITAWGDTSAERRRTRCEIIDTAAPTLPSTASRSRSGRALDGYAALPETERRAKAAALAPTLRSSRRPTSRWSATSPTTSGCWNSSSAEHPRLAELGTSCPDHFLRTKVKPLVLDLPADATVEECIARLRELHEAYRADYQGYYDRNATPTHRPSAGRTRRSSWCPGWACSPTARTSRPLGWRGSSTSTRST